MRADATFFNTFSELSEERGPLCVGLDPTPGVLARWALPDTAAGALALAEAVVASLSDMVAVFKPQSAFFERFGPDGFGALHDCVRLIRDAGCLCLLDVKRGDIGSTMDGYAAGLLRPGPGFDADAVTLHPYLGLETLRPAIEECFESPKAVFVVVLSSNPEGRQIQTARVEDGRTVAELLIDEIVEWNDKGGASVGPIGAVLGATSRGSTELAGRLRNGMVLAPGLGAQGAEAGDLASMLEIAPGRVLPSSSRSILMTGPDRESMRSAVRDTQETFRTHPR